MRKSDQGTYKKIEEYSYSLSNGIGKGYSSQVYKGKNDSTEENVAIKVIDMRLLKGDVHKNLLASQIEVLKSLRNCPNIIEMFDVYNTKSNTYIITQLCDGGDLGKTLNNRKTIPETQAVDYVKQIINGYSYLYKQGIIHRDLKPANVFLKDGKLKIADFGFAMKSAEGKKYCSYNVGSPIYMPPEALNQNKYSFKSDIWAIGVIFYEMLTGRTPWKAKTQKQLGRMLTSIPIKKVLPRNISQSSTNFLLRALEIDQHTRMCPDELTRFIFDDQPANRSTSLGFTQRRSGSQQKSQKLPEYSLTRNSINTPKNPRFNIIKGGQENKNASLPKTAATISGKTEHNFGITANNHIYGAQHNLVNQHQTSQKNQNKIISKQLLSQIHFCRFLFKLLQRIKEKINNQVSISLRNSMAALIFERLDLVKSLELIVDKDAREYKNTQDYDKISQIIKQYQEKYSKDLSFYNISSGHTVIKDIKQELQSQILAIYGIIKQNQAEVDSIKEEVIVLDYLVTLKQLLNLIESNNIEQFHNKSKMQAIVEGAPAKNITHEHVRAITSKLRAIKLL